MREQPLSKSRQLSLCTSQCSTKPSLLKRLQLCKEEGDDWSKIVEHKEEDNSRQIKLNYNWKTLQEQLELPLTSQGQPHVEIILAQLEQTHLSFMVEDHIFMCTVPRTNPYDTD